MSNERGIVADSVCPLCCCMRSAPRFKRHGYTFRECRRCRTLFVDTVPAHEDLKRLYEDASPERGSTLCWEVSSRHDASHFARVLETASSGAGRGPVLDVGCGTGPFLVYARRREWNDLTGLEISPRAAAEARRVSGAVVWETPLDGTELPCHHYAVVTLWDVLEHLQSPSEILRRIYQLLRPGGVVAVSTPNRFGLSAAVLGRHSVVVCPPEHLLIASRRGLRSALIGAGLAVDGIWSEDLRIREWTRFVGVSKSAAIERQNYCDVHDRLTAARWFETARATANVVLRLARIGDQLLAIAKRPRG